MRGETKLRCRECGAEMNRHAEKIDFSAGLSDPGAVDADLGGALAEFHACAQCGNVEERIIAAEAFSY
jgi:hypothetical protein